MIHGPPIEGTSNELADWLELEAFSSVTNSAPIASINETLEIAEDDEPVELDEENLISERRLQQVTSAIHERTRAIGHSYPFVLDESGSTLTLSSSIDDGGYAYLFCLIVSAAASDGCLAGEGPWRPNLVEARSLFQICATIACAGHIGGPAFSVGWPRPDSSSFLNKLRIVYREFGDGQPYDQPPPGAPKQVKDDEIDVIAWQHANNVKPSMGYFLGQAASGANWPDKSLRGRAEVYHKTWFSKEPASQLRVGTIMPFFLPSPADADPADHRSQNEIIEEIDGLLRRHAATHGDLLHRHRVASFVQQGVALHNRGIGPIERIDDLPAIASFVTAFREQLRISIESA